LRLAPVRSAPNSPAVVRPSSNASIASPRSGPRSPVTSGNSTPSSGSNVRRKSLAILRQALENASCRKEKGERRKKENVGTQNISIGNGDTVSGISPLNQSTASISAKENDENNKPQDDATDNDKTLIADRNKKDELAKSDSKNVSKSSGDNPSNPSNEDNDAVEGVKEANKNNDDNASNQEDHVVERLSTTKDAGRKKATYDNNETESDDRDKNDEINQDEDIPESENDKSKRVSGQGMPRPKTPPRNKKKLYNARAISTPQVNKTVLGENVTFLGESVMELSAITVLSPASTVSDPDSRRGSQSRARDDTDAVSFRFKKGGRDLFDKLVDSDENGQSGSGKRKKSDVSPEKDKPSSKKIDDGNRKTRSSLAPIDEDVTDQDKLDGIRKSRRSKN